MNNKNNCVSDGHRLKREIRDLVEKSMNLNHDLNILVFSKFRDGFSPCANLTSNHNLILHAFALLPTDATVDCCMNTYLIALGHKARDDILTKTTCIEEINKLENSNTPLNVYSRKHGRFISVALPCSFASMDQIEKKAFALFAARNRDWGPLFGLSCNCKDFKDQLPSCKS